MTTLARLSLVLGIALLGACTTSQPDPIEQTRYPIPAHPPVAAKPVIDADAVKQKLEERPSILPILPRRGPRSG
jgi:hypothetical protein